MSILRHLAVEDNGCRACNGAGYTQEGGTSGAHGDPTACLLCHDGEMYREMEARKAAEKRAERAEAERDAAKENYRICEIWWRGQMSRADKAEARVAELTARPEIGIVVDEYWWDDLGEECGFSPLSCPTRERFIAMVRWTIEDAQKQPDRQGGGTRPGRDANTQGDLSAMGGGE